MKNLILLVGTTMVVGACSGSSSAPTTPTDEATDTGDTPSTSHHVSSSDSDSDSTSNAIGTGPTPSIGMIPCHVDESAPPAPVTLPNAKGPKPNPKNDKATDSGPVQSKTPITVAPAQLGWKIDRKRLGAIYDKVIDADFKDKYEKVQPGTAMTDLDHDVQEQKDTFRRTQIDFEGVPTGIDASPLKGEYTYNNKESMMHITRNGKTRDFFFIQGKLWKVVDELPLGGDSQWGKDFTEAVTKISTSYGGPGRVCPSDPAHGRVAQEVDWRDGYTQVRAIDWQNGKFGLVFVDLGTLSDISNMRTAKQADTSGVDPSVQDVMHTPTQPPPKDDKTKKKP